MLRLWGVLVWFFFWLFDSYHMSIGLRWLDSSCQPARALSAWCRQGLETLVAASSAGLGVSCSTLGLGASHGMVIRWGSWCPCGTAAPWDLGHPRGWWQPGAWVVLWDSGILGLGVPCRRTGTARSSLQAANSLAQVIKSQNISSWRGPIRIIEASSQVIRAHA